MSTKRWLTFIGALAIVIAVAVFGFIGYLQLGLFGVEPIRQNAMDEFVDSSGIKSLDRVQDNLYEAVVPVEVVNQELAGLLMDAVEDKEYEIINLNVVYESGIAQVNIQWGEIYVPVTMAVEHENTDTGHRFVFTARSYGAWGIPLPGFIDSLVFGDIFNESLTVQMNIEDYNANDIFVYESSELDAAGLICGFRLQLPNLDDIVDDIKNDIEDKYIHIYENGSDEQKEAISWIDDYDSYKDEVTSKIFDDFLGSGEVLIHVLAMVKPDTTARIYEKYPQIKNVFMADEVMKLRERLVGEAIVGYGQHILESLETMIMLEDAQPVMSAGHLFDLNTMSLLTVEMLDEMYRLETSEGILREMKLVHDGGKIFVIYHSEEGVTIRIGYDGYNPVDEAVYQEKYNVPLPSEGRMTDEVEVYEALYFAMFMHFEEDLFIRYLKNDEKEAFAIISLESDFQNYKLVILRKEEEGYQVLGDGFANVREMNTVFPDFNLNLATRMNEETKLQWLNTKTRNNIINGLKERGFMSEGEEMIYCSFDGVKYISIMLNSGEEYIYTLYREQFLDTVYTKENALERFADIDPMILLHPNPNTEDMGIE